MNSSQSPVNDHEVEIDLSLASAIIYTSFGLMGISGNGLVLLVIAIVKDLRGITNLFVVNQSLIDFTSSVLLIAIFVVPLPQLPANNLIMSRFLCGFWYTQYPFWATYAATIINLMILTWERYFAVVHPLQYRIKSSCRKAFAIALIPWLYGFLHMSYLVPLTDVYHQTCYQFLWPSETMQVGMGIYTFFILFLTPFSSMILLHVRIALELRKGSHQLAEAHSSLHESNLRDRARKNTVKTLLILCICYCICWAPNNIIYLYYCLGGNVDFSGVVYYITVCVSFINIWINPIVYALQYRKFQHGLRSFFRCPTVHEDKYVEKASSDTRDTSV